MNTSIDLNVLVHSLVDWIDRLESNLKERKKVETQLKSTLKEANKLIIAELQHQLLQHMSEISPKVTYLVSNKKDHWWYTGVHRRNITIKICIVDYDFWIPFVACAEYLKCLDQTTYIFPVLQEEKCSSRRGYKKLY